MSKLYRSNKKNFESLDYLKKKEKKRRGKDLAVHTSCFSIIGTE